jgi:hypothetical protein
MESYTDMKARHRKEIDALPICYAFNKGQLDEAKKTLGDVPLATFGFGSVYRKADFGLISAVLDRHEEEHKRLREDYKALEEGFLYEMSNHEFNINWQGVEDVLRCFGMTEDDLRNPQIKASWDRALSRYWKEIEANNKED